MPELYLFKNWPLGATTEPNLTKPVRGAHLRDREPHDLAVEWQGLIQVAAEGGRRHVNVGEGQLTPVR